MKKRILILILVCILLLPGCGKENKYVNVGVNMTTEGMSLYLVNAVQGFKKVSTYVLFAQDSKESVDRVRLNKHGIDITYLPVKDLGLIKKEDDLKVVFPDCFTNDGELKGVWVANTNWLENAPTYSYRFIQGLALSADYRTAHMTVSYTDAYNTMKGVRDIDWEKYPETMEYCAAYASANNENLEDTEFVSLGTGELKAMFEGFAGKTGKGYELCLEAYNTYCGSDSKSFEELFDFTLALKAFDDKE